MASHIISNNSVGDFANVHNGNVYNNWTGTQAQNDSDAAYLYDLRITDPRLDKKRILDTKGPLLGDSYRWIFDHQDYQRWLGSRNGILWIKGDPGKGKTMLLCGVIESLEANEEVENEMAYFFCQATDARINTAAAILGGLTFYLARRKRSLLSYVRERHLSPGKSLFDGPDSWATICDIFEAVIQDSAWSGLVLVVDALDECVTDRSSFLRLVVRTSSKVKWLLSSRNLEDIERRLLSKESVNALSLELKENAESVSQAVHSYIDHCVSHMEILQGDKELENQVRDTLQRKADNTFLWAALAIQQLRDAMKWEVLRELDQMPEGLQSLYQLMLNQIRDQPHQRRDLCTKLLSIVTTSYRPLHLGELSSFWMMETECPQGQQDVHTATQLCGSFLTVKDGVIYFIHQSAKDFILQQGSQIGIRNMNLFMFKSSLDVMSQILHRNMYNLESPSAQIDEIPTPCPDPLACLRYQCMFWMKHLLATSEEERAEAIQGHGSLYTFFTNIYLYWLEAISLLRATNHAIGALNELLVVTKQIAPALKALMEDAIRFLQYNRGIMDALPLQIYSSALTFAPECSIVRQNFLKIARQSIPLVLNRPNSWGARAHTLFGHRQRIVWLEFSPTSHLLVSSSLDGTARIWDVETGDCQQILRLGNCHWPVKISPDSTKVASMDIEEICIWNIDTGEKTRTLHGNGKQFCSIAFSSDSKFLVSAYYHNETVCIWCTETGNLLRTLQCPVEKHGYIKHLAFSPDLRYVVAAGDKAATIWDIDSADELWNSLRQGAKAFLAVAFSPNSKLLATAHWLSHHDPEGPNSCINVWCIATGRKLQSCHVTFYAFCLQKLAFVSDTDLVVPTTKGLCHWQFQSSSDFDSKILLPGFWYSIHIDVSFDIAFVAASEINSNTISIWQLNSSDNSADALDEYGTFAKSAICVAISPDLSVVALGSDNTAVTLWRTDTGQYCRSFTGHAGAVTAIGFSHDSSVMVTCDMKRILRLWKTKTGECINILSILPMSSQHITSYSISSGRIAVSADSRILACCCDDEVFILRKGDGKEYEYIANYPVPRRRNERDVQIEHIAVSLNSVFVTWAWPSSRTHELDERLQYPFEHWQICMDQSMELHVSFQHRSTCYEENESGLSIARYSKWGQLPDAGEFAWIIHNGRRLIWIPTEFRPNIAWKWDASGSILAIGVDSNTMIIMDFSRQSNTVA